ncbi:DUF7594 domain-containing protein [Hyalangium rubrum]|uniref:DNRLRE domain-containing protein n=1 Tax=Hyalangium rubrum TaxID=3103134 RepID=A0ABU5H6Q5_9BACT|nr:DNRLRE domain-containing protein [Hyalangium sp. s54d21]MDY7229159.1 DNRLRE domain-containing protein [Hyalangium sp. s54d21]
MRVWGWGRAALIAALLGVVGCGVQGEGGQEARALEAEPSRVAVKQGAQQRMRTLTFPVAADTWADESAPNVSRGSASQFKVDGGPRGEAFLRFDVSGVGNATVRRATLRLYAVNPTSDGPEVYATSTTWTESGLTWNNRPPRVGIPSADAHAIPQEAWVGFEVTPHVRGDGAVAFLMLQTGSDGVEFLSREAGRNPAQLVLEVEDAGGGTDLRFSAEADAHVQEAQPTTNFGNRPTLEVDGSPRSATYLRFRVAGVSGNVVSAKLRLFSTNPTSQGPSVHAVADPWDEQSVTWNTRPALQGESVDNLGAVALNEWVELDVTQLVSGDGVVSVGLVPLDTDGVDFNSREAVDHTPELVVTVEGGTPPSGETRTFGAVADAYTDSAHEWGNFNTAELRVDTAPSRMLSFLRFDVSGLRGDVASAKLRLFVLNGTSDGPSVWTTSVDWSESSVTDAYAPYPDGGPVANAGPTPVGSWLELDVTGAFLGGPLVSFALVPESTDGAGFASSEHPDASLRPQLVVTTHIARCAPGGGDTPASGTYQGGQSWGGTGYQTGNGVAVDAQGHRILIAQYEGSVDFGGGALPNHGTGDISDSDIALVKRRADGSHVWSKGFGAPGSWARAEDVAVDTAGNIAVVGFSRAGVNLGSGVLPAGGFAAKFSPEGVLVWARPVDGDLRSVAFDSQGHVLASGQAMRAGSPPGSQSNELLVLKLSAGDGTAVWFKRFQATTMVRGEAIAVGPSDEVVVGGSYQGTVAFGTTALPESSVAPFLAKLSPTGYAVWVRGFLSSDYSYAERAFLDVAVAADGAIAGVGAFSQWIRIGTETAYSTGLYSAFLAVVEPDGSERWWRWMGNEGATFGRGVAIDAAGDVVVMGTFRSTLDFGGGPLTTAPTLGGPYEGFFVAKYRMACGEHRWSQQLSHGVYVWARGLAVAPDRSITLSGLYDRGFGPGMPGDGDNSARAMLLHFAP